ncbi:metal ABC transporter substrate-binding protein [Nocardioides panacisoli]|uniref:metal ABC transporter substrate-binding protein n=1 Tax=Nocardioides panacisoli TaxID=627624 RepID=UPI001C62D05E|nr:metal ABC transporter substrate-binding protein [Nocardioides panacisoli]QYJ05516.1 metal ABC transporter substrate-binding protein [Nocardioides panacisoli]
MRRLLPLLALPLALSGCSAFGGTDDGDGVEVATAFYPLQYVTDQVAGEHADVSLITQPGRDPHDLELTVNQTAEITGADLVVYLSEFQPAIDAAVDTNAEGATYDAADAVDQRLFGEGGDEHAEHAGEGHSEEEHSDEEGHEDHDHAEESGAEGEHDHDHGTHDPHFWHDPLRMADLGDEVAEQLAEVDPDHAEDFRSNAADLRTELEGIDEDFASGLAECERSTVVTSHDAFSYLDKYGLEFEAIAGLAPDAEATPAHIAELQELIREEGLTTVFTERLAPSAAADTIAGDLGLQSEVLDPIAGLDDETAEEDYASLMAANLEALRSANGCR